ncbi:L-serine ammonia-lyase, iron-sulfur-dependent subunit beta [Bifidobacterium sp. ESL0682]|uniref:L-serine ammonia-lyase, iron-sulfur-dependent subunit beta n=1 Tax=Bifidobacterium sp. ESL0682 TaxID=2983212 RepID=UPI0023F92027|nr:L-serine ammonia-lyase, iron-sulfur-dependent subunit beta [Bifidobacterium sp. ESL0682]WEV41887.1 L-serine ammonia-lyase, iron-sulfur-dependent subunit beta [Bifidobacterium sp. ESL0682]
MPDDGPSSETANYKSVFDIIGPVMIGPSSSHTAGVVAIGRVVHEVFRGTPTKIVVDYYESFASTHQGHGTDFAIIGGILGFATDDRRIKNSIEIAKQRGIDLTFVEQEGKSPVGHPNTAVVNISDGEKSVSVVGVSIGGGVAQIKRIVMDGFDVTPRGPLPMLLLRGSAADNERLGSKLQGVSLIGDVRSFGKEGTDERIYEYDLDAPLPPNTVEELRKANDRLFYLR